jgi:hypothetical protein
MRKPLRFRSEYSEGGGPVTETAISDGVTTEVRANGKVRRDVTRDRDGGVFVLGNADNDALITWLLIFDPSALQRAAKGEIQFVREETIGDDLCEVVRWVSKNRTTDYWFSATSGMPRAVQSVINKSGLPTPPRREILDLRVDPDVPKDAFRLTN